MIICVTGAPEGSSLPSSSVLDVLPLSLRRFGWKGISKPFEHTHGSGTTPDRYHEDSDDEGKPHARPKSTNYLRTHPACWSDNAWERDADAMGRALGGDVIPQKAPPMKYVTNGLIRSSALAASVPKKTFGAILFILATDFARPQQER